MAVLTFGLHNKLVFLAKNLPKFGINDLFLLICVLFSFFMEIVTARVFLVPLKRCIVEC